MKVASPFKPAVPVRLFDSTLRDGEQGARRAFSPNEKANIAAKLEQDVKVDIIDAGFPGASEVDYRGVQRVVGATSEVTLAALAHGTPNEIDVAVSALRGAEHRSRVSTFHRALELSQRYDSPEAQSRARSRLLRQAKRAVEHAAGLVAEVQYYLVYCGDRDEAFLTELAETASNAGATQIVIADSQSTMTPGKMKELTERIVAAVGDKSEIAVHCHNQLGMALPNTIAAIAGGAVQVESCLLGLGDAGGNLATEQFLGFCVHFSRDSSDDPFFPPIKSNSVLPEAASLAKEVSRIAHFQIGENQPLVGERVFTCTTGIHQTSLSHLGHTTFDPASVNREWKVALNRHSSRKALSAALLNAGASDDDMKHTESMNNVFQWMKQQPEEIPSDILKSRLELERLFTEAYETLQAGGVVLIPTTVGYTLCSLEKGARRMEKLKGRPDGKPFGILGTPEIYKDTFGSPPATCIPGTVCMGFIGRPRSVKKIPSGGVGPNGEVGIWLNLGPVHQRLAERIWEETGELMIATSCNKAGGGNPTGHHFSLDFVDEEIRSKVDLEFDVNHWEVPEHDVNGRWLSAPILELESGKVKRVGRRMDIAAQVVKSIVGAARAVPSGPALLAKNETSVLIS